jgi:hypothetical protein
MMKLQDVLLKAMAKKITWSDAAEVIGVTVILGNLIGRVSTTERRARRRIRTSSDRAVARASPHCLENLDPAGCAMEQPHVSCRGSAH